MKSRVGQGLHLVKRFVGSLRPGSPSHSDQEWVKAQLLPGEFEIWEQMSNPDRRHAVGVARAVAAELDIEATRPVLAAALLHDSGKVVSNLRTPTRALATVFWVVVDTSRARGWQDRTSLVGKMALYRLHPELGADLLTDAGSDQLTIRWAAEHHQPVEAWTVPRHLGRVLKDCDDD